jgi:hypothetical protein
MLFPFEERNLRSELIYDDGKVKMVFLYHETAVVATEVSWMQAYAVSLR